MKNLNKKGFTIVELVIVIAVIAILAAVLIPTFNSVISRANESAAMQEAKAALQIITAHEGGDMSNGKYYFVVYDKECVTYAEADGAPTAGNTGVIKYVYCYDAKHLNSETSEAEAFYNTETTAIPTAGTNEELSVIKLNKTEQSDVGQKIVIYHITTKTNSGE